MNSLLFLSHWQSAMTRRCPASAQWADPWAPINSVVDKRGLGRRWNTHEILRAVPQPKLYR